jgi:hypothetical protein
MMTTEHFQRFARRAQTAPLQVFPALPDSLTCIRLRRDIQQALIDFGACTTASALPLIVRTSGFFVFLRCFMNFAGLRRNVVMA